MKSKPHNSSFLVRLQKHCICWTVLICGFIILEIVGQLLYPVDRTLPLSRVADIEVGGVTKREAISKLFKIYGDVPLSVRYADETFETTLAKAGVLLHFQKSVDAVSRYPTWQRLVPFSIAYKAWVINAIPELVVDSQLAKKFAKTFKETCDIKPKDAAVSIKNGHVALTDGKKGRQCNEAEILNALKKTEITGRSAKTTVATEVIAPVKTTDIATKQFETASRLIRSELNIAVNYEMSTVPAEEIASWIVFMDDKKEHVYGVDIDSRKVRSYLETAFKEKIYLAPEETVVTLLDGVETTRAVGSSGQVIDYKTTTSQIIETLKSHENKTVALTLKSVSPTIRYISNYSESQRGLEQLLLDIASNKGSYGIVVTELGGMHRSAAANGDRVYVTASLFKLFIVYKVLKELEAGTLKEHDVIVDGLNVTQCFEEMIVRSANRCAVAYMNDRYGGGSEVVSTMHSLGFTSVKHPDTWYATPRDIAKYMEMLQTGELLQGESRSRLIGLLKRQLYRNGIPTGVSGTPVADKVGFLWSYTHDAAIVYDSERTYILVVMTNGGSYSGIADVARRVQTYLQR